MERCAIKLLILLDIFLNTFNSFSNNSKDYGIMLPEIDINSISNLQKIMEDVISEKETDVAKYYVVSLQKNASIIQVFVTEEPKRRLVVNEDYKGFFTLGNDTIIVSTENHIDLRFTNNIVKFTTFKNLPIIYDPTIWEYIIDDRVFARYILGIGWMWMSNEPPVSNDLKKDIYLTAPKRISKNTKNDK